MTNLVLLEGVDVGDDREGSNRRAARAKRCRLVPGATILSKTRPHNRSRACFRRARRTVKALEEDENGAEWTVACLNPQSEGAREHSFQAQTAGLCVGRRSKEAAHPLHSSIPDIHIRRSCFAPFATKEWHHQGRGGKHRRDAGPD